MSLQGSRQTDTGADEHASTLQSGRYQWVAESAKKKTMSLPDKNYQEHDEREMIGASWDEDGIIINEVYQQHGRHQRTRKLTEKGMEYKVSLMKKKVEKIAARLTRKYSTIENLLYSAKNMLAVEEEMHQYNDLLKLLMSHHGEYNGMLEGEEQIKNDEWFDRIDEKAFNFKRRVQAWIKEAEEDWQSTLKKQLVRGLSCKSSRSGKSNGSIKTCKTEESKISNSTKKSVDSKRRAIEEKAKLAELLAEESFLKEKQKIENEAEMLRIRQLVAKAQARSRVFEEQSSEDEKIDNGKKVNNGLILHQGIGKCNYPDRQTLQKEDEQDVQWKKSNELDHGCRNMPTSNMGIAEALCKLVTQQSAPDVDLDVFDGNPLEYNYFMSLFHELVEKRIEDPQGRLTRLIKYTKGDAKEMIKHCVQQHPAVGYRNAKDLLHQKYGNPYIIMSMYRQEIKTWPQIKKGDGDSFQKFLNFLVKCESLTQSKEWNPLDTPDVICMLLSKLPGWIRDKWVRVVRQIRNHQRREATLNDFITLIKEETLLLNDPLFSKDAIDKYQEKKIGKQEPIKKRISTYTVKSRGEETGTERVNWRKDLNNEACIACGERHILDRCDVFMNKTLKERTKLLANNKRCYGCYQPMSKNHNARNCKERLICRTCKEHHPTGMHGYVKRGQNEDKENEDNNQHLKQDGIVKCASVNGRLDAKVISMCIVPVWVGHKGSRKMIKTYAMLDNCSQGSFIQEDLMKELDISGQRLKLSLKTLTGEKLEDMIGIDGLIVSGIDCKKESPSEWIEIPRAYTRTYLPVEKEEIATPRKIKKWNYLDGIACEITQEENIEVGMLIGANCTKALEPISIIPSKNGGPYAYKTKLGWCIVGPIQGYENKTSMKCHLIAVQNAVTGKLSSHHFAIKDNRMVADVGVKEMFSRLYHNEFSEVGHVPINSILGSIEEISKEDKRFLDILQSGTMKIGSHYEVPLPFRDKEFQLPNNRNQAVNRMDQLKKRFLKDQTFFKSYKKEMEELTAKGYSKKAKNLSQDGKIWYLPHHGVKHASKPDKVRVVFDCSTAYGGTSLNQHILSGPDLTNQLSGILMRFRTEEVAFMGDIEAMFYQVHVPESQRSVLRYLWWENNNLDNNLQDYEMGVHVFGATSSPGCCNFALRKTAIDNESHYEPEVIKTLLNNFYVDDLLKSVDTEEKAIQLIKNVKEICRVGGFNLTKFTSNNKAVLQSIPELDRKKSVTDADIKGNLPIEKALGIYWDTETDVFKFKINLKKKPMTRRGMLSIVSSIYDPLGFVAPYTLEGKRLLQRLCQDNIGWDTKVTGSIVKEWEIWCANLMNLEKSMIKRCYKPKGFGKVKEYWIHHFSDASEEGYGQVSFLRMTNHREEIHCCFVMGKARVTPRKFVSIPRLELTAAALSVKVATFIKKELKIDTLKESYWSDSKVVLGYIRNNTKKFKVFVANRIQQIHEGSKVENWRYIPTNLNPADYASRGLIYKDSDKRAAIWLEGPTFLWHSENNWPKENKSEDISDTDPEVKNSLQVHLVLTGNRTLDILENISSWKKIRKVVAFIIKFKEKTTKSSSQSIDTKQLISLELMQRSETAIIKMIQRKYFQKEFKALDGGKLITKDSNVYKLDPFLDKQGMIRVGGRASRCKLEFDLKHPILLPKEGQITSSIIDYYHEKVAHAGRGMTINEIRSQGYWIVSCTGIVKSKISKCVVCQRLRGKTSHQKMGDLPEDRLSTEPPFTYCGVDMFGPFYVKDGRKTQKRYGAMFTCLSSRAVHIETTNSMTTDSFIQALRRFLSRRGNVRIIRSDNGTNFVGASIELRKAFGEMDKKKINKFLMEMGGEWISWKFNPPTASNMGGAWERQIRTARGILSSLLMHHGERLNDESLRTLLIEVEGIINSRPLTVDNIGDVHSILPLSPMQLLTMKTKIVMPPPGVFQKEDMYCRKQWRRVQHVCNEFWTRWQKEVFVTLQHRQKWNYTRRNFEVDDIVLLREEASRNQWPMARIVKTYRDSNGFVRSVQLMIGRPRNGEQKLLDRPVNKLVLLVGNEHKNDYSR